MISICSQVVALVCGLFVPKLMISTFGSEAYGATASIAQFLAYISLLEGGIGGVARAALYRPLAENNIYEISCVVSEIKRFFRVIAVIFTFYTIILAGSYYYFANVEIFDWATTALLVLVISISTFAQYFVGISYFVLLQAAQRTYITQLITIFGVLTNAIMIVVLISFHCSLITVKLVSSIVFAIKPFLAWDYVRREYKLIPITEKHGELLEQKWEGLGQHIAYFLFSNTDIAVLTIFQNLKMVAVYSVYNMVNYHMQNFALSFMAGAEAMFGDMLAKNERKELDQAFQYFETLISFVSILLFAVTGAMIIPFVRIYTRGVTDINYEAPLFGILLVLSSVLYCLRQPYHLVVIAAGHFRQTKVSAYGEALLNIGISLLLVRNFGLTGVAAGTVISTAFRQIYYVFYLQSHIMHRSILLFVRRCLVNGAAFLLICGPGYFVTSKALIPGYVSWVLYGIGIGLWGVLVMIGMTAFFYREDLEPIIRKVTRRR